MNGELIAGVLTDEQKGQIRGILSVGCDRQTAADYVGCTLAEVRRAMQHDVEFAQQVCHSEAGVELSHMKNVYEKATAEKMEKRDWRASVWWLEQRSPERYGGRTAGTVTARQLKIYITILGDVIHSEVHSSDDRKRVLARLAAIEKSLDQLLRDSLPGPVDPLADDGGDVAFLETNAEDSPAEAAAELTGSESQK